MCQVVYIPSVDDRQHSWTFNPLGAYLERWALKVYEQLIIDCAVYVMGAVVAMVL